MLCLSDVHVCVVWPPCFNTAYDDMQVYVLIKRWCIQTGVVVLAYFDNSCILAWGHLIFSEPTYVVIPDYASGQYPAKKKTAYHIVAVHMTAELYKTNTEMHKISYQNL